MIRSKNIWLIMSRRHRHKIYSDFAHGVDNTCGKPFFMAIGLKKPHKEQFIPEKYFLPDYITDFYREPYNYPYNNPKFSSPANGITPPPQPDIPWADFYALPAGGVGRAMAKGIDSNFTEWADALSPLPEIDPYLSDSERLSVMEWSKRANAAMAYIAAVKFVDAQIGRLYDSLAAYPDILNNTILF